MNHWAFVTASYVITGFGTFALLGWAFAAMRRAEGADQGQGDEV